MDFYRPDGGPSSLTWRKLRVLIEHLPPESATMTALRNANPESVSEDGPDPAKGRWSQAEMLLASAVDELRYFRHAYATSHTEKGKKGPPSPDPIPRPGTEKKKSQKTKMSDAQADFLWRHINGLPPDPNSPIQFQSN